jgi:hypothetical protein
MADAASQAPGNANGFKWAKAVLTGTGRITKGQCNKCGYPKYQLEIL